MNINDLKQIRKKLEKEYNENCTKIGELSKKIKIIELNDFEIKAIYIMTFSMLAWIATTFLGSKIVNFSITPLNLVQPLFLGIPVLIGITGEKLFLRKLKSYEKLRKFSKAKTQKEKIEESTRYEIKREKLRNWNKILKQNYDDLSANENLLSSLSRDYNITEKNIDKRTKDEIETNIANISELLQKKQQDIDITTTKCVLINKFFKVRDKWSKIIDVSTIGMLGACFCMIFYNIPIITINEVQNIHIQASFLSILAPAIVVGIACSGYCIKRNKDYTTVFHNINKELGNNAISEIIDYEEDEQINNDLENILKVTCAVNLKLESEKQKLNNICQKSNTLQNSNEVSKQQMDYAYCNTPKTSSETYVEESIDTIKPQQSFTRKKTIKQEKK